MINQFPSAEYKLSFFAWRKGRIQKCFAHPTSIIIREKSTNELIAFVAIEIEEKNASKEGSNWPSSNPKSPGWLNRSLATELIRGVDLYDLYGTNRILHLWFGAVRNDNRNQQIFSKKKINAYTSLLLKISGENRVGAWKVEAYNHFACRENFWQVIRSINFEDFQLPDRTKPLTDVNLGVHRTARLLACRPPYSLQELNSLKVLKSNL